MFDFFKRKPKEKKDIADISSETEVQSQVEETRGDAFTRENWLQKIKSGLSKTRERISERIRTIAASRRGIDENFYNEVLEILIETDMGYEPAEDIVRKLRREIGARNAKDTGEACDLLVELIARTLASETGVFTPATLMEKGIELPEVILLTGVNGSGKTTVCGKLSKRFKQLGYKILLVAGDTFRAAAIDQLRIWGERANVDFFGAKEGQDPSSVVFDALAKAKAEKYDAVIIDTAGRLQNKVNLMNELGKIRRTVDKHVPLEAVLSLLVIDATTGQNAVSQAKVFGEIAKLDGIVLTKLDGTAKGGIVLAIKSQLNLPVVEIGVGESIDDLVPFDAGTYARSLLGELAGDEINWRAKSGFND